MIFWSFYKTAVKWDATEVSLLAKIDFDTGNRSPLVLGARDTQKSSEIHVKIQALTLIRLARCIINLTL